MATEDRLRAHEEAAAAAAVDVVDATPFNENLFVDEDLDALDDELNELSLNDDNGAKS